MKISPVLCLLGLTGLASAFVQAPLPISSRVVLSSTNEARATEVPLVISGTNIELTPALVEYVNKRVGGNLNKLGSNGAIRECDVHLSVNKNPKVRETGTPKSVVFLLFIVIMSGPARCQLNSKLASRNYHELTHCFVAWPTGEKLSSCRSDNQFEGGYDSFQIRVTRYVRIH
jgi:Sigma 54 modulation protein / S30EA ribosomal protein